MSSKFLAKSLGALGACAAALALAAAPTAASADVHWVLTGQFDDGGSLGGFFDIDQYGFLTGYDVQTTAGTAEGGFDYTPSDSYFSNGAFYVDFEPQYQNALHLAFADDLGTPVSNNPILGGSPGPSFECVNSWSCYVPSGGTTRYIASGFAAAGGGAVPEPAAWTLMLTGFGLLGATLRSTRRRSLQSAA